MPNTQPSGLSIVTEKINGRNAVVSYLTSSFEPADVKTASIIKAVFDDGNVIFYKPQHTLDTHFHIHGLDEFKEEEHPRAHKGTSTGGQFVKKGTSGGTPIQRTINPTHTRTESGAYSRTSVGGSETYRIRSDRAPVKAVYAPTEPEQERLTKLESQPQTYHELGRGGGLLFSKYLRATKAASKYGSSVTVYDPKEYDNMRTFINQDGTAGFALNGEDIVSVFCHPHGPKNANISLLQLAIEQGGRRLDCFDTALPYIYSNRGFRCVARIKFNDEYAPRDWDYEVYKGYNGGRPDVLFMVYDPNYQKPYDKRDGILVTEFDQGTAIQKKFLQQQQQTSIAANLRANEPIQAEHFEAAPPEYVNKVHDAVIKICKEEHYDPSHIRIHSGPSISVPKRRGIVGDALLDKNEIYIYPDNGYLIEHSFPNTLKKINWEGVVRHEITHQKFNKLYALFYVRPPNSIEISSISRVFNERVNVLIESKKLLGKISDYADSWIYDLSIMGQSSTPFFRTCVSEIIAEIAFHNKNLNEGELYKLAPRIMALYDDVVKQQT